MKAFRWMLAGAFGILLISRSPALAQGNSQGHGHGKGHDKHHDDDDRDDRDASGRAAPPTADTATRVAPHTTTPAGTAKTAATAGITIPAWPPLVSFGVKNLALRHEVGMLQRSAAKRLKLASGNLCCAKIPSGSHLTEMLALVFSASLTQKI